MAERIQRSRRKGWRKPDGAVIVTRPSKYGNPYVVHTHDERCPEDLVGCPLWCCDSPAEAVRRLRHDLLYPLVHHPFYPSVDEIREELSGKDLVCWCPLVDAEGNRFPCHADLLISICEGGFQ